MGPPRSLPGQCENAHARRDPVQVLGDETVRAGARAVLAVALTWRRVVKQILDRQANGPDDLLPVAAGMAFQEPLSVTTTADAEAAVPILVSGTARRPASARF